MTLITVYWHISSLIRFYGVVHAMMWLHCVTNTCCHLDWTRTRSVVYCICIGWAVLAHCVFAQCELCRLHITPASPVYPPRLFALLRWLQQQPVHDGKASVLMATERALHTASYPPVHLAAALTLAVVANAVRCGEHRVYTCVGSRVQTPTITRLWNTTTLRRRSMCTMKNGRTLCVYLSNWTDPFLMHSDMAFACTTTCTNVVRM
jgi:hypothetical protein